MIPQWKIENIILNVWDSLPNKNVSMKKLANALFGFTYSCEKLFSSMIFVKSSNKNKLRNKLTEKFVKCMNTEYEANIKKLAVTTPLFIETTGFMTHKLVLKRNN